jgi:hypothetical protein
MPWTSWALKPSDIIDLLKCNPVVTTGNSGEALKLGVLQQQGSGIYIK